MAGEPLNLDINAGRNFTTCPFYLDGVVVLQDKDGKLTTVRECQRAPINIFGDPFCNGCPIKPNCCAFYKQKAKDKYQFCPIDGKKL